MASVVTISDALYTDGSVVSAQDARLALAAQWAHSPNGSVRTGIVWAGTSNLLVGTASTSPSMTVTTTVPMHFVGKKAATLEGCYVGTASAVVALDIAAAPGSNSRIDVVYVMQRDTASTTSPDSVTQAEVGVITGTAAASPAKPSIPVGAVEIGTVTVSAGVTKTTDAGVTVTTTALWTAPHGSPIPVRNQAERDALTQYDGLTVARLDLDYNERSNGSTWTPQVNVWPGGQNSIGGGPNAPAGARRFVASGSVVVTTQAGGTWAFSISPGFPNALMGAVISAGDRASNLGGLVLNTALSNNTTLNGYAYIPTGTAVVSSPIRINYYCEGW